MRPDSVREWLRRVPFVPFRLHLTNGVSFEIRHPEQAAVGRDRVAIEVGDPSIPGLRRTIEIALLHITHIEQIPVAPSPSVN